MSTYRDKYQNKIKQAMRDKFGYNNVHQVPKIEKIIVNCVTRDCVTSSKTVDSIKADLAAITGQRPVTARAKKSIASFKVPSRYALGGFCDFERGKNV